MSRYGRELGANIYIFMKKLGLNREQMAEKTGYSFRDICRIIDGRLIISPARLSKIAEVFGITKSDLARKIDGDLVPELQYMKEFDNPDNLDKVLDLIDMYVELEEAM
ncbi:MAG: helix-turn-helix domain-containing protein [Coprococcus sp.]